jgi:cellular nucleic acid-binding protein
MKAGGAGGGAGRACHNCKQEGHMSRDCPEPKVMRCRNCDEEGHSGRECPQPKDWSRVQCNNCKQFGHTIVVSFTCHATKRLPLTY